MKKQTLAWLLAAMFAVAVAGCGGGSEDETTTKKGPVPEVSKSGDKVEVGTAE